MLGRTDSRRRMVAITLIFAVLGSAATFRLGYWQVVAAPELTAKAEQAMQPPPQVKAARALIIDRNGKVLAQTASYDRLDAHPSDIDPEDRQRIVDQLTPILDLDAEDRARYLTRLSADAQWTWLERRLTREQSLAVANLRAAGKLPGISLEPRDIRTYPRAGGQVGTTLASHLIGFVGDGRGAYGVERLYDDRLSGADLGSVDIAAIASAEQLGIDAADPPPLALTIDARLQRQLERELSAAKATTRAKSISAIVMDPHSGAILASASVPGYDANDFGRVARDRMGLLRDPVVSEVFEPGSVMKIFTATAALDKGVVTPQSRIKDERAIRFYEDTVHNSDKRGYGMLTVKNVIAMSRNVATAKIAQRLAPKSTQKAARELFELWDRVGLVGRTGVDIAGEESGIFCDPTADCRWAPVDLANRAFGQGVAVTLVQLANGFSTLVNGGYRVQPHVVVESEAAKAPRQRVLKPKVARQATEILTHVTGSRSHYARGSLIPGYWIGGKTGTAQIWDSRAGVWKDNIFNHNFVGFVGGDKPEAVIAVRIEEPKAIVHGQGNVEIKVESYELFRNIARAAIKHLDIRKSKDKDAGLPIWGSHAAKRLTPWRTGNQARVKAPARGSKQDAKPSKRGTRPVDKQAARTAEGRRDRASKPSARSGSRSADREAVGRVDTSEP